MSSLGDQKSRRPTQADYAAFGEVETARLPRNQVLAGRAMSRSWNSIPHVTHQDDVDVTALEAMRERQAASGTRLTILPFCIKAIARALRDFPAVNASLDADDETLILKKYFHIGVAIDTSSSVLIAVVRDCERKGVEAIAAEIAELSARARGKGLSLAEMTGGCFTVSSLGKHGGTAFTPIINAPETAILGLSAVREQARRGPQGGLEWRRILPVSLSYDHRVINGALAARFVKKVAQLLGDPEELLV